MDDKKPVHIRLSSTIVREVDHYAVDRDLFRSDAVEDLIRKGLEKASTEQECRLR